MYRFFFERFGEHSSVLDELKKSRSGKIYYNNILTNESKFDLPSDTNGNMEKIKRIYFYKNAVVCYPQVWFAKEIVQDLFDPFLMNIAC
jgi:hypothetical protein